jgi:hypothetical protein
MTQRVQAGRGLAAALETSPGSGVFEGDERLRVEEVRLRSDGDVSTATVSVRLDDGFGMAEAAGRYHADLRILVRREHSESALRRAVFEGHPAHRLQWDGLAGRGDESFAMTVEHAFERLARTIEGQVSGRHEHNGAATGGWAERVTLNAGASCSFNAGGTGNCSSTPVTVADRAGVSRSVYVFAAGSDPSPVAWSCGRALRYLFWFHTPGHGPVFEGNVFTATEGSVDLTAGQMEAFTRGRVLDRAMVGEVNGLNCEGKDAVAALRSWGEASGVHLTGETVDLSEGRSESRLRIWANDEGPVCPLRLARGGVDASGVAYYDVGAKTVREIARENDTYRADVTRSDGGGVTSADRIWAVDGICAVPWLDFSFAIGDRVRGVEGRGIGFGITSELAGRFPSVVGKWYRLSGGRYETGLALDRSV